MQRAEITRARLATAVFAPRVAERATRLWRVLIELIDGDRADWAHEPQVAARPRPATARALRVAARLAPIAPVRPPPSALRYSTNCYGPRTAHVRVS